MKPAMSDRSSPRVGGVAGAVVGAAAVVRRAGRPEKDTEIAPRALVAPREPAILPRIDAPREERRTSPARAGPRVERKPLVVIPAFPSLTGPLAAKGEVVAETVPRQVRGRVPVAIGGAPVRGVYGGKPSRGPCFSGRIPVNAVAMGPTPVIARVGVARLLTRTVQAAGRGCVGV